MHLHPQFELWPHVGRLRGQTHWWLETPEGTIIDLTADQYTKPFPYHKGKRCGFLTVKPSKRAQAIIEVLVYSYH